MQFVRWVFGVTDDAPEDYHVTEMVPVPIDIESPPEPQLEPAKEEEYQEKILVVSVFENRLKDLGSGPTCFESTFQERVVQREIRWGDKITVGPLPKDSTMILTLSDGSLVKIPFPPPLSEDRKLELALPTFGEAAYLVEGMYGLRQCLIRWEAIPYDGFLQAAPIPFRKSTTWKALNAIVLPMLYFCLCFYSLYKLGLFGNDTISTNTFTPNEFSYLVLPLTLLIGMWVSARSFYSAVKLRLKPQWEKKSCFRRSRRSQRGNKGYGLDYDMDKLLWNIMFVDISDFDDQVQLQHDAKLLPDSPPKKHPQDAAQGKGPSGGGSGERGTERTRTNRRLSESLLGTDEEDEREQPSRSVSSPAEEKFILWHDAKDHKREHALSVPFPGGTGSPRRRLSQSQTGAALLSPSFVSERAAVAAESKEWPFPLPEPGRGLKEYGLAEHVSYWGGWSTPDYSVIRVRGKNYMTDHQKIPAGPALFNCVCVDLLGCKEKITHVAARPHSYIQRLRQAGRLDGKTFHLVVNFEMPGTPLHHSIVAYLSRGEEEAGPAGALLERFINGDDEYRNDTFKMIPRIVEGNWFVVKTVGQTPAIIGRKLTLSYYINKELNYLEVDVDVGSSVVGSRLQGLVQAYTTGLVIDLSFVLQGVSDEELPERLLGGLRIIRGDLTRVQVVPTEAEEREKLEKNSS